MADTSSTWTAYAVGYSTTAQSKSAFLLGGALGSASQASFLYGGIGDSSNINCYMAGYSGVTRGSVYSYLMGGTLATSSLVSYSEGLTGTGDPVMAEYDYIWLKSSDNSIQKKFRVLAQGYDDGTLEKAEDLKRTIGGGLDHSVGAIYQSWNPIIRVRASEPVTDYGSLSDLRSLFELINPNGTPTNIITFIDHHGDTYYVRIVGPFQKALMGVKVEGENAWSIVKLKLVEVPS